MNKIKSITALLFVVILSINVNITAYAVNDKDLITHKTIETNGYVFDIAEKTDKNFNITRAYTKDITNNNLTRNLNETKALVMSLGMSKDSVNELYTDTLYTFADSLNIWVTTTYTKYNEENNTSTQVSEAVAKAEANKFQTEYELGLIEMGKNTSAFSTNVKNAAKSALYKDSYMKVTHTVAYKGSGSYLFSVDAEWLTMPIFRGNDSIGACAMNCTVTPNTSKGYFSYKTTVVDKYGHVLTNSYKSNITNKQNAINGNWYGSAGIFNLPNNGSNSQTSVSHSELKAHYEYKGHISHPKQASWFNTVGTYKHSTITLSFSPSIGIDLDGKVSASIGLDMTTGVKSRSAELEIYYKP